MAGSTTRDGEDGEDGEDGKVKVNSLGFCIRAYISTSILCPLRPLRPLGLSLSYSCLPL
jgi:hypothetical protein